MRHRCNNPLKGDPTTVLAGLPDITYPQTPTAGHGAYKGVILKSQLDSTVTFRTADGQRIRGTIINAQRHSLVMEVYLPYSLVKVSEVLHSLTVRVGTHAAYTGKAFVSSLVNTGLTTVVSVTLVDEWANPAVTRWSADALRSTSEQFVNEWEARFRIRSEYATVVNAMRAFLAEVSRWIDQIDLSDGLPRDGGKLRSDVFDELAGPVVRKLQHYLGRLEEAARVVESELVAAHRSFLQSAIHPLLLRAPFVHRTYTKPLGYAGDYQMVNQIMGNPQDGPSTYFQIVNKSFLDAAVARAHRNRIDLLVQNLKRLADSACQAGRTIKVLNVGCGPAIEVQRFVKEYPRPEVLRFELVDFNEETLNYARSRIGDACTSQGKHLEVTFLKESVNDLLKSRPHDTNLRDCDAVYCAGLFDYLSDKVCNRLISYFTRRARPGASFLFTNVHARNPDRLGMEHLLEWYLIYRDESTMRSLVHPDHVNVKIYSDDTGVNLFAESSLPDGYSRGN